MKAGKISRFKVRGRLTKTGEEAEFVGKPIDVSISDEVVNFKAIPEDSMKHLLIGGIDAVMRMLKANILK